MSSACHRLLNLPDRRRMRQRWQRPGRNVGPSCIGQAGKRNLWHVLFPYTAITDWSNCYGANCIVCEARIESLYDVHSFQFPKFPSILRNSSLLRWQRIFCSFVEPVHRPIPEPLQSIPDIVSYYCKVISIFKSHLSLHLSFMSPDQSCIVLWSSFYDTTLYTPPTSFSLFHRLITFGGPWKLLNPSLRQLWVTTFSSIDILLSSRFVKSLNSLLF